MLEIKFINTGLEIGHEWMSQNTFDKSKFRYWFGTIRQQAITWTSVDPDLCHHVASLGHNVSILKVL